MNVSIFPERLFRSHHSYADLKRLNLHCADPELAGSLAPLLDVTIFAHDRSRFAVSRDVLFSGDVCLAVQRWIVHSTVISASSKPVLQLALPLVDDQCHSYFGQMLEANEIFLAFGQYAYSNQHPGQPALHLEVGYERLADLCCPFELEFLRRLGSAQRICLDPKLLSRVRAEFLAMLYEEDDSLDRSSARMTRLVFDLLLSGRICRQGFTCNAAVAFEATMRLIALSDWKSLRSIERLSSDMGISARSLEREFKDQLGLSPKQAVLRYRFAKARKLLLTDDSIEFVHQAAGQAGFSQIDRFAGQYRRLFGELPSETIAKRNRIGRYFRVNQMSSELSQIRAGI